jgi:hypothetical protein
MRSGLYINHFISYFVNLLAGVSKHCIAKQLRQPHLHTYHGSLCYLCSLFTTHRLRSSFIVSFIEKIVQKLFHEHFDRVRYHWNRLDSFFCEVSSCCALSFGPERLSLISSSLYSTSSVSAGNTNQAIQNLNVFVLGLLWIKGLRFLSVVNKEMGK